MEEKRRSILLAMRRKKRYRAVGGWSVSAKASGRYACGSAIHYSQHILEVAHGNYS
jgi:hypothetical protein